jgi:HPr kinase/phosphorylase
MDDGDSIDALFRQHQASLELTRVTAFNARQPRAAGEMSYWIGEYHPEQYHAVEVIGPENLREFESRLQQGRLYQSETLSTGYPGSIILAHGQPCEPANLARLAGMSLAVIQTPLPIKTVIRHLAYSAAETGRNQLHHGVVLSVCGEGVLLGGASGLGKSGIALELIARGHQLVADDAPLLHRLAGTDRLFAVSPPLLADLLEVRAAGILDISKLFGDDATLAVAPVDLCIDLVRDFQPAAEQRLQAFQSRINILGVEIPHLHIPLSHTANPALLVETITRNHVLYKTGYDAGTRLIDQQRQLIKNQTQ